MDCEDLRTPVRAAIAEALGIVPAQLPDPATVDTVNEWDSLGHFQIIELLADRFGVTFDHREAVRLVTEDAIVTALAGRDGREHPGS